MDRDASSVAIGPTLAQKREDKNIHPGQFATRVMSTADRLDAVCKQESFAVVFGPRKRLLYLLFIETFLVMTSQQALKA